MLQIVSLYELSLYEAKTELYMMMELMDCDLHRVIQSKQPLSEKHFKCFIKQILEGIKGMHSIGVFHRDLKPGNILVSKDCQVSSDHFPHTLSTRCQCIVAFTTRCASQTSVWLALWTTIPCPARTT